MKKLFTLLALTLLCVGAKAQVCYSHWITESTEGSKPKDNTVFNFTDGSKWDFGMKAGGTAKKNAGDEGEQTFSKYTSEFTMTLSNTEIEGTVTKITLYNYFGGTVKTGDDLTIKVGAATFGKEAMCQKDGKGKGGLTHATVFTGSATITKTDKITISFASNDYSKGVYVAGIKIEYTLPAGSVLPPTITESTEQVGNITVTMSAETGTTIKYTVNGGSEQTYTSPITIDSYAEVTAWAVNGKKQSTTVSATYVVMPDLSAGKKWDFSAIGESDWTNLAADGENWAEELNTDDNSVIRYNNKKAISGILIANDQVLKGTEGLKFNVSSADKIRINKKNGQLQLNGSNLPISIPFLKAGQYITVIAKSGSSSKTDRYISATNVEAICGFAVSGTADVVTSIGTVKANGTVDLQTVNGGMNILSIEISNDMPSVNVIVSEAGFATFTSSVALDFSSSAIKAYKASVSGSNISFTRVNQVAAGEGVLLYAEGGKTEDIPVGSKGVADTDNAFVGTLTDIDALATDEATAAFTNYILNDGASGIGFYKANGQKVAAGKAYLRVDTSAGAKTFFGFDSLLGIDGVVTGINEVKATSKDNMLYNLNGVRVAAPNQKGVYILSGKKYVVK